MAPLLTRLGQAFGFGASTSSGGDSGGITSASGGVVSEYEVSGTTYRAHVFRNTGTFTVTAGSGNIE